MSYKYSQRYIFQFFSGKTYSHGYISLPPLPFFINYLFTYKFK
ncbi:Uncharacterised protein [Klebsiella variicola]|uniref:Uncharacterized protein n=1 Tax=Klebsiella quasivariicola TaxID=2026240 RepID=A0A8B4TSQ0_9ENTR|nr:Uncharacterised protein [Klebsiella variicola]SXD90245.1 Uncharacterised protein [Klebsiella quasivariicola]